MALRQCAHKSSSVPLTSMYLVPRWCLCLFNASSLCSPFSNLMNASPFLLPWAFKQKAMPPLIVMIKKNVLTKLNCLLIASWAAMTLNKFSPCEITTIIQWNSFDFTFIVNTVPQIKFLHLGPNWFPLRILIFVCDKSLNYYYYYYLLIFHLEYIKNKF